MAFAAQVCYKSCSDQIRGEILRLNCVSLSCPENTGDEKILAILFAESLEGIGWNFEVYDFVFSSSVKAKFVLEMFSLTSFFLTISLLVEKKT